MKLLIILSTPKQWEDAVCRDVGDRPFPSEASSRWQRFSHTPFLRGLAHSSVGLLLSLDLADRREDVAIVLRRHLQLVCGHRWKTPITLWGY